MDGACLGNFEDRVARLWIVRLHGYFWPGKDPEARSSAAASFQVDGGKAIQRLAKAFDVDPAAFLAELERLRPVASRKLGVQYSNGSVCERFCPFSLTPALHS